MEKIIFQDFKETEIGPIPTEWEVVRLREVVAKMRAGGTPRRNISEYWGGDIPFVLIEDMTNTGLYLTKTKENVSQKGLDDSSAWIVPPYSLLLSMYATIGETAINIIPVSTNQAILAIIPNDKLLVEYGAYSLKFNSNKLKMHNIQSTQKNVNKGIVENFQIPLPPIPEQKAIANVLSTVQENIEKTEAVIDSTKELKKSLMSHLFTYGSVPVSEAEKVKLKESEVGLITEDWKICRLEEIASIRNEPISPKYALNEVYVGLEHIIPHQIRLNIWGTPSEVKSTKNIFYKDDILYGKLRPYLDKSVISDREGICSTDIIVIKSNPVTINNIFLAYIIHHDFFINYAIKTMTGVNHPRTSWSKLKNLSIPLPPLPIQKEIADILSAVDAKIEAEENKAKALEKLFQSLLNDLMTGKIRVREEVA